jgi:hypothetical protein
LSLIIEYPVLDAGKILIRLCLPSWLIRWAQAESAARDDNFAFNINRVLEDPEVVLAWSTVADLEQQAAQGTNPWAPRARGAQ